MHARGASAQAGHGAVLRACIVDDHTAVRQWLTGMLDGLGIAVCATSETVVEGVAAILAHHPDLAVIDNRLPDGPGIDVCREVSGSLPEVALILHTGLISPLEETQAYQAGVSRVALKSIHGHDLIAAVTDLASRQREPEPPGARGARAD
jgi:DNA-binding NarL/FixJ family response regulator